MFDLKARKKYRIPVLLLMENAGRAVAQEAVRVLKRRALKVAVFCGKGNNGGDGLCSARHLLSVGVPVDVYLACSAGQVTGEAKTNLLILRRLGQRVIRADAHRLRILRKGVRRYGLIIDALLGVGLQGAARGIYADLINLINGSKAHVLSVDVPSGFDAANGRAWGPCVRADTTVTFVAKKRGMETAEGRHLCGRVRVVDLGVPY